MKPAKKSGRAQRKLFKKRGIIRKAIFKKSSALPLAYRLTRRASMVGFDWPDVDGILKKLDEEVKELREALSLRRRSRIREEIGDLLFVMVNIARFLKVNPEAALRRTIEKFTSRFAYIESALQRRGKTLRESNLKEMDRLWEKAKKKENKHE